MISKNLLIQNNIHHKNLSTKSLKNLSRKFNKILLEIKADIKKNGKTLHVLNKNFNLNFKIKDLKKFRKFKTVILIGMGGSILGSEAIYYFLQKKIKKKFYFLNNIDENKIKDFKKEINLTKVLFIIISKSGNTIETLSNMNALNIIKKESKNIIIISEKKNNNLFSISKKFNLFYIEHKNFIGGRYSVLSEVGLIPAYFMGININKIRGKILDYLQTRNKTFLKMSTIKIASLISSKKTNSLIFLNYYPELEKFLFWCQQLIAESLGKNNKGLLPVISNAPKDHHSLLQLYLDGPKDKLFYVFNYEKKLKKKIKFKNKIFFKYLGSKINLSQIKIAQRQALLKSLKIKNIPYREFRIKSNNEEFLGELFSFFILETVIIGKLLKIDPYDQPAVEQVKIFTKRLLS